MLTPARKRLYHLHECEVLLPPDVLGVHADEVVSVHYGMDKAVEHDGQVHISVVACVHVQPVELQESARAMSIYHDKEVFRGESTGAVIFDFEEVAKNKNQRAEHRETATTMDCKNVNLAGTRV